MHSTTSDVENVFNSVFGGDYVDHVDKHETLDSKGTKFQVMFVHFKQDMPTTKWADLFYQKLDADSMVRVMTGYKKFFWKVYYNKSTPKVPHIMTEEEEANLEAENALKAVAANSLDSAAAEAEAAEAEADEVATEEDVILSECD
jgi:hypothetical protein